MTSWDQRRERASPVLRVLLYTRRTRGTRAFPLCARRLRAHPKGRHTHDDRGRHQPHMEAWCREVRGCSRGTMLTACGFWHRCPARRASTWRAPTARGRGCSPSPHPAPLTLGVNFHSGMTRVVTAKSHSFCARGRGGSSIDGEPTLLLLLPFKLTPLRDRCGGGWVKCRRRANFT